MTRSRWRETIGEKPELLKATLRFNGALPEVAPEAASEASPFPSEPSEFVRALERHPEVRAALRRRTTSPKGAGAEGFLSFEHADERTALLTDAELGLLCRMITAALLAERMAARIRRDDVLLCRRVLGEDPVRWALLRGRFMTGSLAKRALDDFGDWLPFEAQLRIMPLFVFDALKFGWSESLQKRMKARAAGIAAHLPETKTEAYPAVSPETARLLRHFARKLIRLEMDTVWKRSFA